jgi:hypothetical protein
VVLAARLVRVEPSLMIYGPTPMAELGRTSSSKKQAADEYAGESPKGVEPVPGVRGAYMVFDPKTPEPAGIREVQGEGIWSYRRIWYR